MKARLIDDGAEKLGGEFYLAEDWSILYAWSAGQRVAKEAASRLSTPDTPSPLAVVEA